MENAYQHLVKSDGEDTAKKIVHDIYCHLKLGDKVKISVEMIDDLITSLVTGMWGNWHSKGQPELLMEPAFKNKLDGFRAVLDELVYYTKEYYTLEQFLKEVPESEFNKILDEHEKIWRQSPEEAVMNLRKKMTYEPK